MDVTVSKRGKTPSEAEPKTYSAIGLAAEVLGGDEAGGSEGDERGLHGGEGVFLLCFSARGQRCRWCVQVGEGEKKLRFFFFLCTRNQESV